MNEMPMNEAQALAARLEAAVEEMLTAVQALPADLVRWKPAPDVWSVMEILCHVAEFLPFWTAQAQQIVRRPEFLWGRAEGETARLDAVNSADFRSLAEVAEEIRTGAQESARAIRDLRPIDLTAEAESRNPRFGRKPASFVIEDLLVGHVAKHIGQIRRNSAQFQQRS
jgi:uncharacterized damage-inducible protein DinB